VSNAAWGDQDHDDDDESDMSDEGEESDGPPGVSGRRGGPGDGQPDTFISHFDLTSGPSSGMVQY
jgi:hypothetical protein